MRTISSIYGRKRLCVIGLHVRRYTCSRVTSQALRLLSYILQKMLQQLHQQLQQQQQQLQAAAAGGGTAAAAAAAAYTESLSDSWF